MGYTNFIVFYINMANILYLKIVFTFLYIHIQIIYSKERRVKMIKQFFSKIFEYKSYEKEESIELPIDTTCITSEIIQEMSKTLSKNTDGKYICVKSGEKVYIHPTFK